MSKARIRTYKMTSPDAPGKAEFIGAGRGNRGYLRIEDHAGTYIGSIHGPSLVALARAIFDAYAVKP